jgi:hypothetical protein
MLIAKTSVFVANPDCPVREIGSGLVIMAPDGGMTHSLEDIGAFIWRRLDGTRCLGDIVKDLTAEYTVDEPTAEADLRAFLNELLAADLVVQRA